MERKNISRVPARCRWMIVVLFGMHGLIPSAQELVRIKGQVIVPSHLGTPVDLTMDVGDSSCVRVLLHGRGRFAIETWDTERYLLRFEQDGSLTKTVLVDTRFANRKAGERKRDVEFDVVMAPEDTLVPLRYAGPVGRINFHHSNGRMRVEHDRTLVQPVQVIRVE